MTDDDFNSRNREQSLSHAILHNEGEINMATKLTKPVTRETNVTVFDKGNREIIVTLQGDCIVFKLKGLRSTYELELGEAFWIAFKKRNKI